MRGCVLIVEDDADVRETLRSMLEDRGHPVLCAEHGAAALHLLRTASPLPSVILLDVVMPVMDAHAFRREQLADPAIASIPVIVLTGESNPEEKSAQLSAAHGLQKPMDVDELLAVVDRYA